MLRHIKIPCELIILMDKHKKKYNSIANMQDFLLF